MEEIVVNPDRELSEYALVLGLLVSGRTTLDDFVFTERSRAFAEILQEFGLVIEEKGNSTILTGTGFAYKVPVLLRLPESENAMVLLLALASKDCETLFTATGSEATLAYAKRFLQSVFGTVLESESEENFVFRFVQDLPLLKETREGCIPYLSKNAVLLNALVCGKNLEFEERSQVRSGFVDMLGYFGANIQVQTTGGQEMTEMERRIAKARGIKTERRIKTSIQETKILTSRDYFVPGDPTEACAFVSLAVLSPVFKGKKVTVKNVLISLDRAGVFSALKRMGAKIDMGSRHERYGSAYADIVAVYEKRLSSRRLGEDILCTCLEEYPFIALSASTADGESILRIPDSLSKELRPLCENLSRNLKQTGASIGVYEEGLVIRGREELDAGRFDAEGNPVLGLMFHVLKLFSQGETHIENAESLESVFPGIVNKLTQLAQS